MGNSNFTPPFSERQLKAVAIAPKLAAFPSILGSLFIVQHVLRSKERRNRVYHRILLFMSIHDFIHAIKAFVSTWPIPEGTYFVYGARGNTATCTAAGFWGQGGSLTSIFYNGSLTLFFLLVVRYGWKEERIKRTVEPWLHIVPCAVGWSTAIAGIPLSLYNAFGWTCWINSYPFGCIDNVNCERGDNAGIYRWAFFHAELWAIFGFTLVAMFLIYSSIRTQEKVMNRYAFRPSMIDHGGSSGPKEKRGREKDNKRSANFAVQATFYVVVFFFTWFFPMLQTVFGASRDVLYYPLILLSSILSSMQGFSNAVIYLRPRWLRHRKKKPDISRWQVLVHALGLEDLASVSSGFSRSFRNIPSRRSGAGFSRSFRNIFNSRIPSRRSGAAIRGGSKSTSPTHHHIVDVTAESQVSPPEQNKCQDEAEVTEQHPETIATVNEAAEDLEDDDDDDGDEYLD